MTETYRPGDIALVKFDEVDDPYTCVLIGRHRWQSIEMTGLWTGIPLEVGSVIGNVADIATLGTAVLATLVEVERERDQLARWKEEAMPVMDGLQELGKALRIPLGQRITGPAALEAVQHLQDGAQQLRAAAQAFLDAYDQVGIEVWWPEESDTLREVLER